MPKQFPIPTVLRTCKVCGKELPFTHEYFTAFIYTCRVCTNKNHKKYDEANRRDKKYQAEKREKYARRQRRVQRRLSGKLGLAKTSINSNRRRAISAGLPATFTMEDYETMMDYWGDCCCVCGRVADDQHAIALEHWIPHIKGGGFTPENILPMCHRRRGKGGGCNNKKSSIDPEKWLNRYLDKVSAHYTLIKINKYFKYVKQLKAGNS